MEHHASRLADIPFSTCFGLHKQRAKTRARLNFFMQYHPLFVYLNSPNQRQNLLRHFPLPSQPQYYLTCIPILTYLVVATSYCAISTPGGQRLPGGGAPIPPSNHFLRDRVGFRSCPESVASNRGSLTGFASQHMVEFPDSVRYFINEGFCGVHRKINIANL